MPAKKLDYIILCDIADTEPASFIEDWIDANALTSQVVPYDSSEHMHFGVYVSEAAKKASAVVLCLTDNFTPIQFAVPDFQAGVSHDPTCSLGKVFAVAITPLKQTELTPGLNIIDAANGEERDRRRRFVEGVIKQQNPKISTKRTAKKSTEAQVGTTINQTIGRARDVVAAGRDVIQTKKHISRPEFTPDQRHITEATAAKVKEVIEDLANRTLGEDGKPNFSMWYTRLNKRFKVGTFRAILVEDTADLLSWLSQQKAMNRGKLRRSNPDRYRNDLYSVVWANAKSKGMSKDDVYEFARIKLKLKKPITSLKSLGPNQLKHLSEYIRRV